jgi:threonine/homoserine/homoserine lactone efflux protein
MHPLLNGIIVGFTLALLIGPALFVLLQTSIHRGFKAGLLIAAGIFLSDLTVIVLCHAGFSQILGDDPRQNFYFSLVGGMVMIIFGTVTFTRKPVIENPDPDSEVVIKVPGPAIYVLKGFFLNIANPGVWFVWITALVSVSATYGVNSNSLVYFFAGAIVTILSTDSLKCFVAHKLKRFLTPDVVHRMNQVVGIILVIIGAFLIIEMFVDVRSMIPFYNG